MLAILVDPISALFVFCVSALLVVLGWKAASQRSTGLLLAYQLMASFVFVGVVALFTFSLVFSLTLIAASSSEPAPMDIQAPDAVAPMMTLQQPQAAPDYSLQSKASVLSVFDAHAPSALTSRIPYVRSALVSGLSLMAEKKSASPAPSSEPNTEGLPGLDGMTDEVAIEAQRNGDLDGGAVLVAGGFIVGLLLLSCCLLALIVAVVLMSFVFFGLMPFVALLSSIFFAAACRRALLIQRYASVHAHAAACPAVAIQVPAASAIPAPSPVLAAADPAAAAAAAAGSPMMVPANMVYMPHTNMFPMAPHGYVANPYSRVIYVSGSSRQPTQH